MPSRPWSELRAEIMKDPVRAENSAKRVEAMKTVAMCNNCVVAADGESWDLCSAHTHLAELV